MPYRKWWNKIESQREDSLGELSAGNNERDALMFYWKKIYHLPLTSSF
ncbi:MAG: hypothetical protein ACFC1C_02485 [Candidatus Malihini olakiniferum]